MRLAMQVHRARRFYERPESKRQYRERPVPGATAAALPRPEPDFHERCTLVGDHPALQRQLGLVVDLGRGRSVAPRGQPLALGPDRAAGGRRRVPHDPYPLRGRG